MKTAWVRRFMPLPIDLGEKVQVFLLVWEDEARAVIDQIEDLQRGAETFRYGDSCARVFLDARI